MFFIDFIFAFLVALIFLVLFGSALGWRRPGVPVVWPTFFFFLVLMFIAIWAGGIWFTPFGPMLWDTYWVPFVIVGLMVVLLLAAVIAPPRGNRVKMVEESEVESAMVIGAFFWIFLIIGLIAIIAYYAT